MGELRRGIYIITVSQYLRIPALFLPLFALYIAMLCLYPTSIDTNPCMIMIYLELGDVHREAVYLVMLCIHHFLQNR